MQLHHHDIRLFEELSMNAHPSLQTSMFDGWVLRFSNGYTNRANCVVPLYESVLPLKEKVQICETAFKMQELPCVFKLTSASPEGLDGYLEQKGYERITPTYIMTRPLEGFDADYPDYIEISDRINEEWLDAFFTLNHIDDMSTMTAAAAMKSSIRGRALFAQAKRGDAAAACGSCVIERGFGGLYDIMVHPDSRGQGFGCELCTSLLKAAQESGADTAYLQVMTANFPALALYKKLGFEELYEYWYRIKRV